MEITQSKNATTKLFVESGRTEQGDNRSYFVKALNQIIADGFITINIQQIGKVWKNPNHKDDNGNPKKFNIEIKGYGCTGRYYDSNFNAKDLLSYVAQFIQYPKVSDNHVKSIKLDTLHTCECDRCMGQGFIKSFDYYCNGICFQCYGSKYMVKKKTLSI